jgi:hypothetical protein
MTHREQYSEACRKAFEGWNPPDNLWEGRKHPIRKDRPPKNPNVKWTKEQVLQLAEYCKQGLRSFEIAPLMGRSPKAIQKAFVRFHFPCLKNVCPRKGSNNPAWNGGRFVAHNGYIFVRVPDHPNANYHGYVQEHRLVVEKQLGRFLLPSEVVHHKDGNPANNDISNLEVFSSNGEHLRATLQGIPHNVSESGRASLSSNAKKRWKNGIYKPWTEEHRKKQSELLKKEWAEGVFDNRKIRRKQ